MNKKIAKRELRKRGFKVFQKDIHMVACTHKYDIGHVAHWKKERWRVTGYTPDYDNFEFIFIIEPTSIYSGECSYKLESYVINGYHNVYNEEV